MNTYTIGTLFSDYKEYIPSLIENGKILKLIFDEHNHCLTCVTAFSNLVSYDNICQFELKMRQLLKIDKFEIRPKYTPDMLTDDYFGDLCKFLKSKFPLVNGFFDNADATFDNGTFKVELKHGGYELLQKAGINASFSSLVFDLFSSKVDIEFSGVLATDIEEHQKNNDEILRAISSAKSSQNTTQNTNSQKNAQQHSDSNSQPASEFRTCSVDFTRLSLLCDNALVLKGGPINSDERVYSMDSLPCDHEAVESFTGGKVTV